MTVTIADVQEELVTTGPGGSEPAEPRPGFLRKLTKGRRIGPYDVIVTVIALAFAALVAYPLISMLVDTFIPDAKFDMGPLYRTFSNPGLSSAVVDTLYIVGISAVLAVIIAAIFAWLNERTDARMAWATNIFPLLPLLLPPIVLSVGWVFLGNEQAGYVNVIIRSVMHAFGSTISTGPINIATVPGLIFVFTVFLVPYAYLILASAIRNIDPALEEASRMNGAGVFTTLRRITFAAIAPALISAFLLTIIIGLSGYSISATIGLASGMDLLPVYMVRLAQAYPSNIDEAVTLGLCVLIFVGAIWTIQRRVLRRGNFAKIAGRAGTSLVKLGRGRWPARVVVVLYMLLASILPLLAVMLVALQPFWSPNVQLNQLSLNNFIALFSGPNLAGRSLGTSITLGLVGATVGVVIATVLALYVREHPGRIGNSVDGLMKAPGGVSHIVLGIAFIIAFGGVPFFLGGTIWILLLAYLVMYMPQASIAADTGIGQVPFEMMEVSAMSGATRGQTFRRIVLPLVLPAIAGGWAMLFLVMAGDLTASAMLSTTQTPVVGYVILGLAENGVYAPLAALGSILGLISAVMVGFVLYLSRPRYRKQHTKRRKTA